MGKEYHRIVSKPFIGSEKLPSKGMHGHNII